MTLDNLWRERRVALVPAHSVGGGRAPKFAHQTPLRARGAMRWLGLVLAAEVEVPFAAAARWAWGAGRGGAFVRYWMSQSPSHGPNPIGRPSKVC